MKVKYLSGSPEEFNEIKRAWELFSGEYVLEPKEVPLTIEKLTEKSFSISPQSSSDSLEALYSTMRSKDPTMSTRVFQLDLRDSSRYLEFAINENLYKIHFGKNSPQ
jgi:hypothetical protein